MQPSPWVVRFAAELPQRGRIIDLACGNGRHTRWLHSQGHRVLAVDRDLSGVQELMNRPGIDFLQADLEADPWPFAAGEYQGMIVTNYLYRPRLDLIAESLAPGAVLIYETFAAGNERFGRPRNPDFLLQPNELQEKFAGQMDVIAFEEIQETDPDPAVKQRLCARKK